MSEFALDVLVFKYQSNINSALNVTEWY